MLVGAGMVAALSVTSLAAEHISLAQPAGCIKQAVGIQRRTDQTEQLAAGGLRFDSERFLCRDRRLGCNWESTECAGTAYLLRRHTSIELGALGMGAMQRAGTHLDSQRDRLGFAATALVLFASGAF